uniref:Zinc finger MYM-type protein 1-like n=1 Tax=Nothobranchius furzeri TaxID=105023 RepID=A0A8C6P238_NOTFU
MERTFSDLLGLAHPNDPAHVLLCNIKYTEAFIQMCDKIGPCKPILSSYPKNEEGRSFQNKWYENNSWLEYSPSTDAMFCFSCRLFLHEEKHTSRKTCWKTEGFNRWRKALQKIKEHSASESHMCSMVRWISFRKKSFEEAFEVADQVSQAAKDKERERNREILSRLIAVTLYLARQGLPFRGDDETASSQNRGNFLELVELFSKYDSVMKIHLDAIKEQQGLGKRPLVSLLSNRSQNDIIKALATSVKRVIQTELQECDIFSILLDETTDVSHTEQVSFVVRYVHNMEIKERFLQVCNVESTCGDALEKLVRALLEENNLKIDNIRGQGYDGAANMSGQFKGLQSRIQKQNPKALYVHCQAHCLNLVLVDSAKSNICFVSFFNLVEKLYTFVANSSKRHSAFIKMQKKVYPDQRPLELQKLSDTSWSCRETALKTMRKVLPALMQFLGEITQQDPPDSSAGDAMILLKNINFEFLLCLEITCPIFQVTATASDALQQKDMDLASAYKIVDGVLNRLSHSRTEEEFEKMYQQATEKAASVGLDPPSEVPGQARRRKVPAKFKFTATTATAEHVFTTPQEYYRAKVYYTFVDTMTQELQRRFKGRDNSTWDILNAFHYLTVPENWQTARISTESLQAVKKLCQFYDIEEEDKLLTELKVFHASYSCPPPINVTSILSVVKENNAHLIFPNMTELMKTYGTLPVSTATVERSFSKLKLVITKLRTLCSEERLSELLLLAVEKDVTVNHGDVIDIFRDMANRKLLL